MPADSVVQIALAVSGPLGVNAFVLAGERTVIVDAGIPGSAPQILSALVDSGVAPHDVALIVITHAHVDHAGDVWALKQATSAAVAVHRLDAPALAAGVSAPVRGRTPEAQAMLDTLGSGSMPPFRGLEADVLVDDMLDLRPWGLDGVLLHTPGHTDGGLTVLLDSGAAIVGDLIGADHHAVGLATLGPFATNPGAMIESVERVLACEPAYVYCGHGGPFDPDCLGSLRESLASARTAER